MTKSNKISNIRNTLTAAIVLTTGYFCAAAIIDGPTPRPEQYEKVSTNQAFYSTKPIRVEGKVKSYNFKPRPFLSCAKLDMILTDDAGSEIKCESSEGIDGKLIPSHRMNNSSEHKILDAYTALVRNEARDNLKVTAAGKMDGNRLDVYELTVNGTTYILLQK